MRLKTLTPAGIIVDEQIARIRFDALDGSFTFLPKHADFVTVIVPGLVSFEPLDEKNPGHEVYMACDSGVLVKDNTTVLLSVRRAVISENLEELSRTITEEFKKDEENRKSVNAAMARLEVGLTRRVMFRNINNQPDQLKG
ncbi:MAG: F0F1 ATP synthase subunit epsilon [Alphaproteobacteria bacterium]|nr:F0F1 ATP synthase subunit epsilon [Alphaproteobacteria bacterium]